MCSQHGGKRNNRMPCAGASARAGSGDAQGPRSCLRSEHLIETFRKATRRLCNALLCQRTHPVQLGVVHIVRWRIQGAPVNALAGFSGPHFRVTFRRRRRRRNRKARGIFTQGQFSRGKHVVAPNRVLVRSHDPVFVMLTCIFFWRDIRAQRILEGIRTSVRAIAQVKRLAHVAHEMHDDLERIAAHFEWLRGIS